MKIVSKKHRGNKKISRKRNSRNKLSNKQYGGKPEPYSPEATSEGDKMTEDMVIQMLHLSSQDAEKIEDLSTKKQYWLEKVIPSIEMYVEEQNKQGVITPNYYEALLISIEDVKAFIENDNM